MLYYYQISVYYFEVANYFIILMILSIIPTQKSVKYQP